MPALAARLMVWDKLLSPLLTISSGQFFDAFFVIIRLDIPILTLFLE